MKRKIEIAAGFEPRPMEATPELSMSQTLLNSAHSEACRFSRTSRRRALFRTSWCNREINVSMNVNDQWCYRCRAEICTKSSF